MTRGSKLSRANALIQAWQPGFVPLDRGCQVLHVARAYQISDFAVALGALYYQQVISSCRQVRGLPVSDTMLSCAAQCFITDNNTFKPRVDGVGDTWPMYVYIMCVVLAVKMTHIPHNLPCRTDAKGRRGSVRGYLYTFLTIDILRGHLTSQDVRNLEAWVLGRMNYHLPVPRTIDPKLTKATDSPMSICEPSIFL
jgi:hypothetical protein